MHASRAWLLFLILSPLACKSANSEVDASYVAARTAPRKMIKLNGYHFNALDKSCDGLPRLPIETAKGYCVGFMAAGDPAAGGRKGHNSVYVYNGSNVEKVAGMAGRFNLIWPRRVIWHSQSNAFYVSDLGGWGSAKGRIWRLKETGGGFKMEVLYEKLLTPHGLQAHPTDGKIYFSDQSTIYRFDPSDPAPRPEAVVVGLPAKLKTRPGARGRPVKRGGRKVHGDPVKEWNEHPLKHFVFDASGDNFYVNIGAPDDGCFTFSKETKRCEIADYMAGIWKIPVKVNRNPVADPKTGKPHDMSIVFATGLRNSMAIWWNEPTSEIIQVENSVDFADPKNPFEELNIVKKGGFYGWPYFVEYNEKTSTQNRTLDSIDHKYSVFDFDRRNSIEPFGLLPPHSASLDLIVYDGDYFSELKGQFILPYHGWRPTGHLIVSIKRDQATGLPTLVDNGSKYLSDKSGPKRLPLDKKGKGIDLSHIVTNWGAVSGTRPRGRPVGVATDAKGRIVVTDDRNSMIMVLAKPTGKSDAIVNRNLNFTKEQRDFLANDFLSDSANAKLLETVRGEVLDKFMCSACHADLLPTAADSGQAAMEKILANSDWFQIGNTNSGVIKSIESGSMPKGMPEQNKKLVDSGGVDHLRGLMSALGGVPLRVNTRSGALKVRDRNNVECGRIGLNHSDPILARPAKGGTFRQYKSDKKMIPVFLTQAQKDKWITNPSCKFFQMGSWLMKTVN